MAPSAPNTIGRRRRIAVWVLLVVASLLAFVGAVTVWVKRQMLDNHAFQKASTQVIQNEEVRSALSAYLVNQLYANTDVEQTLEQRLPSDLKHLARPLSTALRQPAESTAEFVLGRPRVQQLWIGTTSVAHEKLVNVLENKTGYGISTGNGVVTLNLHEMVNELGTELGVPASVLDKAPAGTGAITLMRSDQLAAAQTGVRVVRVLSIWLFVLVLVLYAAAVYLARGARRETLRNVGWAFVTVGVLVLIMRRVVGNYAVDALTSPTYRGTVHDVWLIGTSILGQIGYAAIAYGVATVAGALLAGPTVVATAARRRLEPTLDRRPGLAAAAVGLLFLLVVLWGPTYALRTWWGVLLFAVLIGTGFLALRRQIRAEFSGAEGDAVASAPISREAPGSAEELARLATLHEAGAISDQEFARAMTLALASRRERPA